MTRLRKNLLTAGALIGLAVASAGAFAQPDTGGRCHDPAKLAAWYQKRQAELHDKLKLTPDQEPAWQAFAEQTTPSAPSRPDRAQLAGMKAPERIDFMLSRLKDREATLSAMAQAVKTFYAALTPEQQPIFDHSFMHGGPRRH